MTETVDLLRQKRDAAEEAARVADDEAIRGISGARVRAESAHCKAKFYAARIARIEADPDLLLAALYADRALVVTAGRVAEAAMAKGDPEAAEQVEALAARLGHIDTMITKLENVSGTVQ